MPYCAECRKVYIRNISECPKCGRSFVESNQPTADWTPPAGSNHLTADQDFGSSKKRSVPGIIALVGIASFFIPLFGFLIGMLISVLIPGCHCDEGMGCRGCGLNELVAFLIFGGFVGAMLAFMISLPGLLLVSGVIFLFQAVSKKN
jgi:hypothetical protein